MNLDDRLRASRDDYRALDSPSAATASEMARRAAAPGNGRDVGDSRAGGPSRTGRWILAAASLVVALVGATIYTVVSRPDASDPDVTVTSPDLPERDIEKPNDPPGAIAPYDERIVLTPDGPYEDGQDLTVTVPEGFAIDLYNGRARVCVTVADAPGGPGEWCDPTSVSDYRTPVTDTSVTVGVRRSVFTPTGWRDCNERAIVCRVVVEAADTTSRASAALEFSGAPVDPAVSLAVSSSEPQGGFEVWPSGLVPDPSWVALHEQFPRAADDLGAFSASVCAFDAARELEGPFGEYLWGFGEEPSLPAANCEVFVELPTIDPSDPNAGFELVQRRWLLGYEGWSDCESDHCFVLVNTTEDAFQLPEGGTVSSMTVSTAALLSSDWVSDIDRRPQLTVLTPGPHTAGQTIEIEVSGMAGREPTNIGICRVDRPWGCSYIGASMGQMGDGRHEITMPANALAFAGQSQCEPDTCYLELDSQGEGLPPLAVAPLDTR